jgi:hypothetical protein
MFLQKDEQVVQHERDAIFGTARFVSHATHELACRPSVRVPVSHILKYITADTKEQ